MLPNIVLTTSSNISRSTQHVADTGDLIQCRIAWRAERCAEERSLGQTRYACPHKVFLDHQLKYHGAVYQTEQAAIKCAQVRGKLQNERNRKMRS
jgi:hypothetical protein